MKRQSILKMGGILGIILASSQAYAICPAAPVGTAADPVLQLKLNADSNSSFGAANIFDSTEEGALVWDDTANAVAYCDGNNWITLGGGGSDNLGNHTATQALALGGNDITGIGTATGATFTATSSNGLLWESGVNSLTHNDGGGNVQMRWGHDYTTSDERFTHGGGAVVMTSNIDATANTALTFKVSSNPGAGNDQPVTWGSSLVVTPSDVTFGGTSLVPTPETDPQVGTLTNGNFCTTDGSAVNCTTAASAIDAGTVDGLDSTAFIRSNANDDVTAHTEWQDNQNVRLGTSADFRMWHDGTNTLMRSYNHGSIIRIQGEDTAGTNMLMVNMDPDSAVSLYHGGLVKLATAADGVAVTGKVTGLTDPTAAQDAATKAYVDSLVGGNTNADTVDSLHAASFIRSDANDNVSGHTEWQDNMDVRLGTDADFRMDFNGTDTIMRGYSHGARVLIQGEDAGGTNRSLIVADPDNFVRLNYAGGTRLETSSAGVAITGRITGLTDPTGAQDAATKAYVDSAAANADTVDGLHAASFLRSDADDSTTGNLAFTSGHGKGLKFWNSDSYKIYMSSVADATWGGNLDGTSDYNMYFRMNGGTNRGFVFRNNTTNVAQIDSAGHIWMTGDLKSPHKILLRNKEPTDLAADGELAFDSSRGLILYRTQQIGDQSGNGGYTVLDTSNIAAGAGIAITNTATNEAGTAAITIATSNVNAATVDSLDSTAFIRSNANDNVTAHTEWQDNQQVRLGNDADFRIFHDASNHVIRGYKHGTPIYIQAEDNGGTNRTMIQADPDSNTRLYYAGSERLRTTSAGVYVVGRITNLTDPTGNQDAATKAYVDAQGGGGSGCQNTSIKDGNCQNLAYSTLPHNTTLSRTDPNNASTCSGDWYGTFVKRCNNGTWQHQSGSCQWAAATNPTNCTCTNSCSCFVPGTMVTMADGTEKAIEWIQAGEKVLGMDGMINTVTGVEIPYLGERLLYAFNGGNFFVTEEHPFRLESGQWASISPEATSDEQPEFEEKFGKVKPLKVGDTIVMKDGKTMTLETIESRGRNTKTMPVFNLLLDGNHTYYADGFLVHNKM